MDFTPWHLGVLEFLHHDILEFGFYTLYLSGDWILLLKINLGMFGFFHLTVLEFWIVKFKHSLTLWGKIHNLKFQGVKSKHPKNLGVQFAIYPIKK